MQYNEKMIENLKKHLLKLIKKHRNTKSVQKVKDKILATIDIYNEEELKTLINIIEKFEHRQKRIASGDAKEVLKEIENQKITKIRINTKKRKKTIVEQEKQSKSKEGAELDSILNELYSL